MLNVQASNNITSKKHETKHIKLKVKYSNSQSWSERLTLLSQSVWILSLPESLVCCSLYAKHSFSHLANTVGYELGIITILSLQMGRPELRGFAVAYQGRIARRQVAGTWLSKPSPVARALLIHEKDQRPPLGIAKSSCLCQTAERN